MKKIISKTFHIALIALLVIGLMPDRFERADLYTDAIVLYHKDPGVPADGTPAEGGEVYLFDDLDAMAASERGLGDPQSLLLVPEKGRKVQVMVPPRNGMPAEAEGAWRSYCVRYNRALEAESRGTSGPGPA